MNPGAGKNKLTKNTPPPSYGSFAQQQQQQQEQQQFTPVYVVNPHPSLGAGPVQMICPTCRNRIVTNTRRSLTKGALICSVLLFVIGCFFCSCLPLLMESFYIVHHTCPLCMSYIGTYKP